MVPCFAREAHLVIYDSVPATAWPLPWGETQIMPATSYWGLQREIQSNVRSFVFSLVQGSKLWFLQLEVLKPLDRPRVSWAAMALVAEEHACSGG